MSFAAILARRDVSDRYQIAALRNRNVLLLLEIIREKKSRGHMTLKYV
jgi:hypothetical protein